MTPKQFKIGVRVKGKDVDGLRVNGFVMGGLHSAPPANRTTLIGVTVKEPAIRSIFDGRKIGRGRYHACRLEDVQLLKQGRSK
ncbi:hypothetical protein [Streptomyces noursei]|uniref:hypothetical protein n=1 Tax=Streptomyces noursei TaxID=1971 RepID=UPI001676264A|nr:hypothetical protein [Streptomyces noursei]MCZ1015631.1 hypothetical protein [Streptomyces noursei]GGW89597.1 hypothetical protein GCM10010341_08050 [Streptomyces noursei]